MCYCDTSIKTPCCGKDACVPKPKVKCISEDYPEFFESLEYADTNVLHTLSQEPFTTHTIPINKGKFLKLVTHPMVSDYWEKYLLGKTKNFEENPSLVLDWVVKGRFKFLGVVWEILDEQD
jgi:hypothetical protein